MDSNTSNSYVVQVSEDRPFCGVQAQLEEALSLDASVMVLKTAAGSVIEDDAGMQELEIGSTVTLSFSVKPYVDLLLNGADMEDLPEWAQMHRDCRMAALQRHEKTVSRRGFY